MTNDKRNQDNNRVDVEMFSYRREKCLLRSKNHLNSYSLNSKPAMRNSLLQHLVNVGYCRGISPSYQKYINIPLSAYSWLAPFDIQSFPRHIISSSLEARAGRNTLNESNLLKATAGNEVQSHVLGLCSISSTVFDVSWRSVVQYWGSMKNRCCIKAKRSPF